MAAKQCRLSFALVVSLFSGCATRGPMVELCSIVDQGTELPPVLECTPADGSEDYVMSIRKATGYFCQSPDDYKKVLKR